MRPPPVLEDVDSAKCDNKLTLAECYNVLSKVSKDKTPGNDVLSCEWHLHFCEQLPVIFVP